MMFQDYALFPHLNVARNVGYGPKMQGRNSSEVEAEVREALALVGLAGFEGRDVSTLSGGEQQRVALARALAPRPRLLMLDEPLGALDRALRERLLDELHGILRNLRQTAIYVTHDQEEAFALADRVLILCAGKAVQAGTPGEIGGAHRTCPPWRCASVVNPSRACRERRAGRAFPGSRGLSDPGSSRADSGATVVSAPCIVVMRKRHRRGAAP